jgi:diamine N-acetyltransferase
MIYGDGVRLRAVEREDIPTFVRWFNDPEVLDFILMYRPMSLAGEERWFEGLADRENDFLFAIEALIDERWVHIGNAGLHNVDWKNSQATFGIALGEKQVWGQGYGTKATKTMLHYAFEELNLHRVELEVFAYNARAIRCYEKAGFRHEGTRRQSHFHNGRYHDAYRMGILREEFEGAIDSS